MGLGNIQEGTAGLYNLESTQAKVRIKASDQNRRLTTHGSLQAGRLLPSSISRTLDMLPERLGAPSREIQTAWDGSAKRKIVHGEHNVYVYKHRHKTLIGNFKKNG